MAEARVDRYVTHPPARVWRTLSDPVLVAMWLPFEDYRPELGHRFTARGPTGAVRCEVLDVEEPSFLRVSWREGSADTMVTITLTPAGTGTRVTIHHTGLPEGARPRLLALWTSVANGPILGETTVVAAGSGSRWIAGTGLAVVAALVFGVWSTGTLRPPRTGPRDTSRAVRLAPESVDGAEAGPGAIPAAVVDQADPDAPDAAHPDRPLTIVEEALPTTLHPLYPRTEADLRTQALLFDPLFYRSAVTGELKSALVASSTAEGDRLHLTLRPDATFHDRTPVRAADVCFSVEAVLAPANPTTLPFRERGDLVGCTVTGPLTADLTFSRPAAELRSLAAVPVLPSALGSPVLPPDGLPAHRPLGTGPYTAELRRRDVRLSPVRSAQHAGRRPTLVMVEAADPRVDVQTLLRGGVDAIVSVAAPHRLDVAASDRHALRSFPTNAFVYVALGEDTFADPRLRDAIAAALDRRSLCGADPEDVLTPCTPISGPWLHGSARTDRSVPTQTSADPERVRARMTEAGAVLDSGVWTREGEPVTVRLGAEGTDLGRLASDLARQLQAAGFAVSEPSAGTPADPSTVDLWLGRYRFDVAEDVAPLLLRPPLGAPTPAVRAALAALASARTATEDQEAGQALHRVVAEEHWVLPLWEETGKSAWRIEVGTFPLTPRTYWGQVDGWS